MAARDCTVFDFGGSGLGFSANRYRARSAGAARARVAGTGPAPARREPRVARAKEAYRLSAVLVDKTTKRPLSSVRVEAWDASGHCTDLLAFARTDDAGQLTIALSEAAVASSLAERKPTIELRLFDAGGAPLPDPSFRWTLGPKTVRARIEARSTGAGSPSREPAKCWVRGRVRTARGAAVSGVRVVVLDVGGSSIRELDAVNLEGGDGAFDASYTVDTPADIVVRVVGRERGVDRVLAESPRYCHAPPTITVDMTIGGAFRGASEHEEITARLLSATGSSDGLGAAPSAELDRIACRHDVPRDRVGALAAAKRFGGGMEELAYGLIRAGLPEDRSQLLRTPAAEVRRRLEEAIAKNYVSGTMGARIDAELARFRAAAKASVLPNVAVEGTSTISTGAMLRRALGAHADAFVTEHLAHEGTVEELWAALPSKKGFERGDVVQRARFALAGAALSSPSSMATLKAARVLGPRGAPPIDYGATCYQPLVDELLTLRSQGTMGSIRDLARFTDAQFDALVTGVGAPADAPGASPEARRANYAKHLRETVRRAFPTTAMAALIRARKPAGHEELTAFFDDRANEGYELGKTRLATHLATTTGALRGVPEDKRASTIDSLKALERLHTLTEDTTRAHDLFDAGIHSAAQVHKLGVTGLVEATGISVAEAAALVDRACAMAGGALALRAQHAAAFNRSRGGLLVLPDKVSIDTALGPPLADWEALFGSEGNCDCTWCHSVLSPAAYLVDLLHFLDDIDTVQGHSAREMLLSHGGSSSSSPRRPDIGKIDLSCPNTDTPLPYVDLVNEILEHVTAAFAAGSPSLTYPSHIATTGEPRDLLARPEILDPTPREAAYAALASQPHPWSLPFHVWLTEARAFAGQLGVSLHRLMHALEPGGPPPSLASLPPPYAFDTHVAWERIGLWDEARDLLLGAQPGVPIYASWGFLTSDTAWATDLLQAKTFMAKSGLTYDELRALLDTQYIRSFVGPSSAPSPHLGETGTVVTCDLTKIDIRGLPPTVATWRGLHWFLRVRSHLGWTIDEVDYASTTLSTLDDGKTDDDAMLRRLAHVHHLHTERGIDVSVVLSWFGLIDTRRRGLQKKTSWYERVFQNPAVESPPNAAFALANPDGPNSPAALADESPLLGLHAATIRAALRLSAEDFALLTDTATVRSLLGTTWPVVPVAPIPAEAGAPAEARLTLANLSTLHRITTWARALGMSIRDMLAFARLWGLTSFTSLTPDNVVVMSEAADRLREGGLSPSDLLFVLHGLETSGTRLVPDDSTVTSLQSKLGAALVNARTGIASAVDPKGEGLRAVLQTLLADGATVDTAMAIFQDSVPPPDNADAWFDATLAKYFAHSDAKSRFFGATELTDIQARLGYAYGHLRAFVEGEKAIAQTLGAALKVSPAIAYFLASTIEHAPGEPLLDVCRLPAFASEDASTPGTPPTAPPIDRADVLALSRASAIALALEVTPAEMGKLFFVSASTAPVDRLLDLNDIVNGDAGGKSAWFRRWLLTVALWKVRAALPGRSAGLAAIFPDDPGNATDDASAATAILARASRVAGWPSRDVDSLAHHFRVDEGGAGARLDEGAPKVPAIALSLVRIHDALEVLKPFHTDASTVIDGWIGLGTARPSSASKASDAIVRAVKARYSDEAWPDVARPLRDAVREKQRDALVAYLISTGYAKSSDELFAWLLIDTETAPPVLTSRIKHAIGSVQTLIQRAQLGLEPSFTLDQHHAEMWKWMRSYRVWEAGRKVFLFPENWMEPVLRDDKTGFFKDFEAEIRRQEITDETAEEAFIHYLERVADIGDLEIVALHHDKDADTVHLVGRTRSAPRAYYYRAGMPTDRVWRTWTAWEKIELDIESDHFLLIDFDRALALVWSTVEQKPNAEQPKSEDGSEPTRTHLEIGLSLSERKNGRWTPPRTSKSRLSTEAVYENLTKRDESNEPSLYDLRPEDITLAADDHSICCLLSPLRIIEQSDNTDMLGAAAHRFLLVGRFAIDPCRLGVDVVPSPTRFALQSSIDMFAANALAAKKAARIAQLEDERDAVQLGINLQQSVLPGADPDDAKAAKKLISFLKALEADINRELADIEAELNDAKEHAPITVKWTQPPKAARVVLSSWPDQTWRFRGQAGVKVSPGAVNVCDSGFVVPLLTFGRADRITVLRPLLVTGTTEGDEHEAEEVGWKHPQTTPMVLQLEEGAYLVERKVAADPNGGYYLTPLSHPSACRQLMQIRRDGIDGLLGDRAFQRSHYKPLEASKAEGVKGTQTQRVPFDETSPSSIYNWELYYHAPLYIAARLMAARRYDEARKWLERIFDPTQGAPSAADANKVWAKAPYLYWKPAPLFSNKHLAEMSEVLLTLDRGSDDEKAKIEARIEAWREDPFKPYAVARMRVVAFQKTVVIKYIQNLIAWGDELFRRETLEAINEATGLYVLARDILGPRPPKIGPSAAPVTRTAEQLVNLDEFGNALVEAESLYTPPRRAKCTGKPAPNLLTQYFCVPGNEKLDELYDTIADRLFKIRHSMNIDGVFRELALFEPPIDPALLVAAAAAGVDINSVLNDLSAGRLPYRYQVLHGRAMELAAGVSQLGQSLLAALEKRDGEELSLLRSGQEVNLVKEQRAARALEVKEATQALAAAKEGKRIIEGRRDHYLALIANGPIDDETASLQRGTVATGFSIAAASLSALASTQAPIPDSYFGFAGFVPMTGALAAGGVKLIGALHASAAGANTLGTVYQHESGRLATKASYARRLEDWTFQVANADNELKQSAKQIAAAEIRLAVAEATLRTHDTQIGNAKAVDEYMREKLTGMDLYEWMADRLMDVYYEAYKLAYDMAKRAERAMRAELAISDSEPRFIGFGYWDSAKKGLTAGDLLQQSLRALEVAYHARNKRELEITKQFSLKCIAPEKLVALRETGKCAIDLLEKHFDDDYPGHYMRRIKTVSVTIPSVSGPYTGVSSRLTLTKSSMRRSTSTSGGYAPSSANDARFAHDLIPIESVVTSSGQNDAGVFELVLRDDRYLPFEGAGAISTWSIEVPRETNGFDVSTIDDLLLHVRYTARDGGDLLRAAARGAAPPAVVTRAGLSRLFSARLDFADAWQAFTTPDPGAAAQTLSLALSRDHFPFLFGAHPILATRVRVLAKWATPSLYGSGTARLQVAVQPPGGASTSFTLQPDTTFGGLATDAHNVPSVSATETWTMDVLESNVATLDPQLTWDQGGKRRLGDALVDLMILVEYTQNVG